MSNISDIIDQIRTAIPLLSTFSDKTELPNPYSLLDNTSVFLKNGWGLTVNTSSLAPLSEFHLHSESRSFGIILTKEVFKLETNKDAVHTGAKALLEDMVLVHKDFLNADQLGIGDKIRKIDFISNSGLQFVNDKKFNFFFSESIYSFQISELI